MNLLRLITFRKVGVFTPASLPNLRLWLDPTNPTKFNSGSVSNNDPVSAWNDSSTSGTNFTQATGANQPTYVSSGINSKPAVYYSGGTGLRLTGTFSPTIASGTSGFTVAIVVRSTDNSAFKNIFSGTAIYGVGMWIYPPGINTVSTGSVNYNLYITSPVGSFLPNTNYVLIYTGTFSSKTLYINNVSSGVYSSPSGEPMSTMDLGGSSAYNVGFSGYIGHVVTYDRCLTTTERDSLYNYLKSYAGV